MATISETQKRNGGLRASFTAAACVAATLLLFSPGAAVAQTWGDGDGAWFVGSNWIGGVAPTSATSATINNGSTVTILNTGQGSAEVDNLTIATGNGLDISSTPSNNSVLLVFGNSISNAGTISITQSSSTSVVPAALELQTNTTLSGGGTVTLGGGAAPDYATFILMYGTITTQTLTSDNTIQGYGQVGALTPLSLINSGTVNANVSGQTLYLNGDAGTNTGTMEATNGGILTLDNSVNNKGGVIIANGAGSTVNVNGVTIQGGTLTTTMGGVMQTGGRSTLDGSTEGAITLSAGSTYTTSGASQTAVLGQIFLGAGANLAIGTASSPGGSLQLTGATDIKGGGTVTMTGTSAFIQAFSTAQTLTNEATIQGYGQIGAGTALSLTNKGSLDANVSGETLYFNGADFLNNGNVFVSGGATLDVETTAFVQNKAAGGEGALVTDVEGTLDLGDGFSLEGGTLEGTGTVDGAVDNTGGAVSPGDAPGKLTIDGSYTQGADGTFDVVIDSLTEYSELDVTGAASLDGLLDLTSKFGLETGDSFTIMELGSVTGDFSSFIYDGSTCTDPSGATWSCTNGAVFQLVFSGGGTVNLDLNVLKPGTPTIPEPSTWGMMLFGFAGLGFLARRRRRMRALAA